ncbi:DUF2267 domain-containing protein [Nocardia transvalensis]|uniref:DUF2267 domain-containing protein n=1 Tax=Nocardia transvalensis TaxID=37333 RepID=UPI001893303D|nr:DUF2267 domain-containing protein [Nocardia transvalensis]MBF6327817.1 DUF2267 domain-containing protein [Nocardia transvalensis]
MQHDEFIGQVQARARLSDRGSAEAATRATLETLAERIPEPLAEKLSAQLPQEIGEHLRRIAEAGAGRERFDRTEFVTRVAERARTTTSAATYQARVVLEVLDEATTGGLIDRLREALPDDLRSLTDAGSSGTLS